MIDRWSIYTCSVQMLNNNIIIESLKDLLQHGLQQQNQKAIGALASPPPRPSPRINGASWKRCFCSARCHFLYPAAQGSSDPLLTPDENQIAAGALLKSRLKVMGNLTTVLTLLLGMEIALLSVIHDVEASQAGVVAIIAASVALDYFDPRQVTGVVTGE
eukprot:scaffold85500_cov58-Phaeocystis_antarctica.AAC.1